MKEWKEDTSCNSCTKCNNPFYIFRRRHHCRICGNIFCHDCLSYVISNTNKIKVCITCKNKKKHYISYLLEQLNKKDSKIKSQKAKLKENYDTINDLYKIITKKNQIIDQLNNKIIQRTIIDNSLNESENIIKEESNISQESDNHINIHENKFNIIDYLQNLK